MTSINSRLINNVLSTSFTKSKKLASKDIAYSSHAFSVKYVLNLLFALLALMLSPLSIAQSDKEKLLDELIKAEDAFVPSVVFNENNQTIDIHWFIAEGYYLYRDKISVEVNGQPIPHVDLNLPTGIIKDDLLFGRVETYFNGVNASILFDKGKSDFLKPNQNQLTLKYQGCHEPLGICFPPIETVLNIDDSFASAFITKADLAQALNTDTPTINEPSLSNAAIPSNTPILSQGLATSSGLISNNIATQGLQNAEEFNPDGSPIFTVSSYSVDNKTLIVNFNIPTDYYLYKDQFNFLSLTPAIWIQDIEYSKGKVFDDPEFGLTEVYFGQASIKLLLSRYQTDTRFPIEIRYQGCKVGSVCLPPVTEKQSFNLMEITQSDLDSPSERNVNEVNDGTSSKNLSPESNNRIPTQSNTKNQPSSLWWILLSAFGAGLLLTFTPCVLPMIPILAGILQRQNQRDSHAIENHAMIKSKTSHGIIAITYVLGTAVTYGFIGAIAGATGQQLQAYFQSPIVIGIFSGLLFIMALSMFNLFKIQLPSTLQNKLNNLTLTNGSRGILTYAFFMGLISALIVGACVSPVLISIIGLVVKQGSLWFGAITLFVMALGMGAILIAFAFGAKSILPKSGQWMTYVNQLMGFLLIAVAIYLLSSIKSLPILWLWSLYCYILGFFIFILAKQIQAILLRSLMGGIALFILCWGLLSTIGGLLGNNDMLRPIIKENFVAHSPLSKSSNGENTLLTQESIFKKVASIEQLDTLIQNNNKDYVFIDYYADWCKDCIRMERTTYLDKQVLTALSDNFLVIKVDVTDSYSEQSSALKKRFDVYGPPASIFLDKTGAMMTSFNFYGYRDTDAFMSTLNQIMVQ